MRTVPFLCSIALLLVLPAAGALAADRHGFAEAPTVEIHLEALQALRTRTMAQPQPVVRPDALIEVQSAPRLAWQKSPANVPADTTPPAARPSVAQIPPPSSDHRSAPAWLDDADVPPSVQEPVTVIADKEPSETGRETETPHPRVLELSSGPTLAPTAPKVIAPAARAKSEPKPSAEKNSPSAPKSTPTVEVSAAVRQPTEEKPAAETVVAPTAAAEHKEIIAQALPASPLPEPAAVSSPATPAPSAFPAPTTTEVQPASVPPPAPTLLAQISDPQSPTLPAASSTLPATPAAETSPAAPDPMAASAVPPNAEAPKEEGWLDRVTRLFGMGAEEAGSVVTPVAPPSVAAPISTPAPASSPPPVMAEAATPEPAPLIPPAPIATVVPAAPAAGPPPDAPPVAEAPVPPMVPIVSAPVLTPPPVVAGKKTDTAPVVLLAQAPASVATPEEKKPAPKPQKEKAPKPAPKAATPEKKPEKQSKAKIDTKPATAAPVAPMEAKDAPAPPPSPPPVAEKPAEPPVPPASVAAVNTPPRAADAIPPPAASPPPPAAEPAPAAAQQLASLPAPAQLPAAAPTTTDQPATRMLFKPSETTLPSEHHASLTALAERMKQDPALRISVVAHATGSGDQASNARRMSLARALAVRAYLIDQGIDNLRINVQAEGGKNAGDQPDRVDLFLLVPVKG